MTDSVSDASSHRPPRLPMLSDRLNNSRPYRTIILASIGTVLEYYDFIIFIFFLKILSQLFFPPSLPEWMAQIETFGIFAAGYLARPIGGIILAHYGDLLGRKTMFVLTIVMMASSSLGVAAMPTYASIGYAAPIMLLFLRLLQSAAIGGEVPGAWTFVAEHVPRHRVGLASSMMSSGVMMGIFLGSLTGVAINAWFPASDVRGFAWRFPFLAGGCAGILSIFLRRYLGETPVFKELRERRALVNQWPVRIILWSHLRGVVTSFVLASYLTVCLVTLFLMTPTLLQTIYSIAPLTAFRANLLANGIVVFSAIGGGLIVDRVGGGWFLTIGNIVFAPAIYLFYTEIFDHPNWLLPLYALVGLCSTVLVAVPYVMINSFPPAVRFTGIAFSYNLAGAIFGGLTPVVVTYGLRADPMAHIHCLLVACVIGMLTGIMLIVQSKPGGSG